ncbi:MAG TPA: hypothetical protein VNA13_04400 [Xanthomonadales bacterium]|nr:hypothetical protein [Xanthomonadales bacterium]
MVEIWGMRQKVSWLELSLKGKKHGRWPVNIDTKFKTVIFHLIILVVTGGIMFLVLSLVNFSGQTLILLGIIFLILNYIFTTWKVDSFHTEIGKLIISATFKKKKLNN